MPRLGEILPSDRTGTVTRRIIAVDSGDLAAARRGRMGGWFYQRPEDLGLPFEDVTVATPVGPPRLVGARRVRVPRAG